MKNSLLALFCVGFFFSEGVLGEDDLVIKKGTFPYMAFIYYDDPSVVNIIGERIMRSAILVRENWLITSALGANEVNDGFPMKTLLARVGALTIDGNFTLNEDEDEQEREVIQIVRPYNHSATTWWATDISLLKTLSPFNVTKVVNFKMINEKRHITETTCIILFFAKLNERSDEKTLSQSFVEVMTPTLENCGVHYTANTMTCANDKSENNNSTFGSDFCHGNSGGPLICDGEVMGIQTYIENQCKEPHLYQLFSAWENFIICGMEEKCAEEHCSHICDVINKDPLLETTSVVPTLSSHHTTTSALTSAVPETVTPEGEMLTTTPSTSPSTTKTQETESTTVVTNEPTDASSEQDATETDGTWPSVATDNEVAIPRAEDSTHRVVETQHQVMKKKKVYRAAAERNMCIVQTVVLGLVLCLF